MTGGYGINGTDMDESVPVHHRVQERWASGVETQLTNQATTEPDIDRRQGPPHSLATEQVGLGQRASVVGDVVQRWTSSASESVFCSDRALPCGPSECRSPTTEWGEACAGKVAESG